MYLSLAEGAHTPNSRAQEASRKKTIFAASSTETGAWKYRNLLISVAKKHLVRGYSNIHV